MRKIKEYRGIYDSLYLFHPRYFYNISFIFDPLYFTRESGLKERRSAGYEEKERRIQEEYQRSL
jgi:hypothetical protein